MLHHIGLSDAVLSDSAYMHKLHRGGLDFLYQKWCTGAVRRSRGGLLLAQTPGRGWGS